MASESRITILDSRDDGARVFRLSGTLDAATAPSVAAALDEARDEPAPACVHVDAGEVDFMDSAGVAVLLAARLRIREGGGRFALVALSPSVEHVLRLTGLHDVLTGGD